MVKVQNFSENLESSLTRLGAEVSKKINSPEFKEAPVDTVVKESIKSLPAVEEPTQREPRRETAPRGSGQFLPSYLSGDDGQGDDKVKAIVENLISLAFQFGVERAVAESRKYPPFVQDSFHDALTEKLVPELKKRGIIK